MARLTFSRLASAVVRSNEPGSVRSSSISRLWNRAWSSSSLRLRSSAQVMIFVIPFSYREAPTIRAFLRPRVAIDRESPSHGGPTAAEDGGKRRDKASPARCGYRQREDKETVFGDERRQPLVTRIVFWGKRACELTRLADLTEPPGNPKPDRSRGSAPQLPARVAAPHSRLRMPTGTRRYGAADALEAGKHDATLARTGRGAPELHLKGPEQSLKLCQRKVPQLAAGDDLRHRFLLVFARPRRSGPFLRPPCDHRQGKACRRRLKRLEIRRNKDGEHCRRGVRGPPLAARAGDGMDAKIEARAHRGQVRPGVRFVRVRREIKSGGLTGKRAGQPGRDRFAREAGRLGSVGFGYGTARRTSAAGLSSRKPS
jgi:hypothetical protein